MARPRGNGKKREMQERKKTGGGKLIGYIRVSTTGQGTNGHSLAGQEARLRAVAEQEGFDLIDVVADVESGAKERDALADVQRRIMAGEAQGIIFPKIDRLGRSMIHLLKLVQWAEQEGVDLLATDEGWQVRDGQKADKMLPFRLAMAEVELERIRDRTREGLRAAREKGVRLGRPPLNVALEEQAAKLRREGRTLQEIADMFNAAGHRTAQDREYKTMTVYRMINRVDPAANPEGGLPGKALAAVGV